MYYKETKKNMEIKHRKIRKDSGSLNSLWSQISILPCPRPTSQHVGAPDRRGLRGEKYFRSALVPRHYCRLVIADSSW